MILGFDSSSLKETREAGGKFYVHGKEIEPVSYFHDELGCDLLRLRLWVDPYDEEGHPYGGGTVDLPTFIELAKEGLQKGYRILLDYHFSDFWCDPSKQFIPKSWRGLSLEEVLVKLEEYIESTLKTIGEEGIELYGIQIGNEITNGTLWPLAKLIDNGPGVKRGNYESLMSVLSVASKTVRRLLPDTKILIHLERSYDQAIYQEYFDEVVAHHIDFDLIGVSYYPYWHHLFDELFTNIEMLKSRYGKEVWIVETSYGFTKEAAHIAEDTAWGPLVADENDTLRIPFPLTQDGQYEFINRLLELSREHGVGAVIYWEPFWLPCPGLTWATYEGELYVHETEKPVHNEWANQCLFDYEGEATKALYIYKAK